MLSKLVSKEFARAEGWAQPGTAFWKKHILTFLHRSLLPSQIAVQVSPEKGNLGPVRQVNTIEFAKARRNKRR